MELNMILTLLMETLEFPEIYSRFDETLQFKQMMNLIVC